MPVTTTDIFSAILGRMALGSGPTRNLGQAGLAGMVAAHIIPQKGALTGRAMDYGKELAELPQVIRELRSTLLMIAQQRGIQISPSATKAKPSGSESSDPAATAKPVVSDSSSMAESIAKGILQGGQSEGPRVENSGSAGGMSQWLMRVHGYDKADRIKTAAAEGGAEGLAEAEEGGAAAEGAAAGGAGAAGALGMAAYALYKIAEFPFKQKAAGAEAIESQREFMPFSPEFAISEKQLEVFRLQRRMRTGAEIGASAKDLVDAQNDLEDALRPAEAWWQTVKNRIEAFGERAAAGAVKGVTGQAGKMSDQEITDYARDRAFLANIPILGPVFDRVLPNHGDIADQKPVATPQILRLCREIAQGKHGGRVYPPYPDRMVTPNTPRGLVRPPWGFQNE